MPYLTPTNTRASTHNNHTALTANESNRVVKDNVTTIPGFPVQSNIGSAEALIEAHQHLKTNGKPVAYVVGGGPGGYLSALALKDQGFHVFVFEKRTSYTRTNNVELKQEALNMVAHLSPDGALYQRLRDAGLNAQGFKGQAFGAVSTRVAPGARFANWFAPKSPTNPTGPVIPDPVKTDRTQNTFGERSLTALGIDTLSGTQNQLKAQQRDQAHKAQDTIPITDGIAALDLAWPSGQVLRATSPAQFQLPNTADYGGEDFGSIMLRDLDHTLNAYCADPIQNPNIQVVNGHASVQRIDGAYADGSCHLGYIPSVCVLGEQESQPLPKSLKPELIVLADGASSENVARLFGSHVVKFEQTQELWHQANFTISRPAALGDGAILLMSEQKSEGKRAESDNKRTYLSNIIFHEGRSEPVINSSTMVLGKAAQGVPPQQLRQHTQDALGIKLAGAPDSAVTEGLLEPFESNAEVRQIPINLRRSKTMADDNLCVMGDAAVSGSPVGGYGASLAMSAWPKAVADYGKKVLAKLEKDDHTAELAKKAYNDQAEQIVRVRIGRPAMIMQHLGGYTLSARRAITSELLLPFK